MTQRGTKIDGDRKLLQFHTYEEYLDSLVTRVDLCYLRGTTVARSVAALGYRCIGETLEEKSFYRRHAAVRDLVQPTRGPYEMSSEFSSPSNSLLQELALRERANRLGTLMTIIFLRRFTKFGYEVSAYIDYRQRLDEEDWTPYFQGKKILQPLVTDLAFYHWRTGKTVRNETPNFCPLIDPDQGLVFKNLNDRSIVYINPTQPSPGRKTSRVPLKSQNHEQVLLYDHVLRRK